MANEIGYTLGEDEVRILRSMVEEYLRSRGGMGRRQAQWQPKQGAVRTCYAKITADNGDGTYNATEQIWDASANDWKDKTDGRTFDTNSDTEPPIQEWNNTTGLTTDGSLTVSVRKHVDDEGNKQWIFRTRLQGTWEATTDASSGKITLKRLNSDGSLAGTGQSFDVIPSS